MLRNMFTIAWRTSLRNRQFSLLNLLGLSIGITASMLIGLYVMHEMSYDNFHKNTDRLYRVNQPFIWGDWDNRFASTGPALGVVLRKDIPEFEEVTRLHSAGKYIVSYESEAGKLLSFSEDRLFAAEPNFFKIFSYPVVKGNAEVALENPRSLVLTETMASKYFGDDDPIGKTLNIRQAGGSPMPL